MENYNNAIKFWIHSSKLLYSMNVIFSSIDLNFDSADVKLERHMNLVCSMITRSENATLQDSNIIELNLSHDCDKQEWQDFFSMKQKHFSFAI